MSKLRRPAGWALFSVLAVGLWTACASTPAGHAWRAIEGPAISVFTDGNVETATELYTELERFRAAALWFTNLQKATVGKVRIVAFRSGTDAIPYMIGKDVGGWASITVDGNLGATKLEGKNKAADRQALKRDLVKMWMDHAGVRSPQWYREGLAELVSAFNVQENTVTIGGLPPLELTEYAKLIADEKKGHPPGELLSETPGRYTTEDRARVWLAVHYLMIANVDRQQALRAYFRAWSKGASSAEAFVTAFGQPPAEFYRLEVSRYGTRQLAARQFNLEGEVKAPSVRDVPHDEIEKLTQQVDHAVQKLR